LQQCVSVRERVLETRERERSRDGATKSSRERERAVERMLEKEFHAVLESWKEI
jgi:hypothetical protein